MEHKHTPGPWLAQDGNHFEADCVITTQDRLDTSKGPIAQLDTEFNEPVGAEQRANARLIAAAPDLLEALIDLLGAVEGVPCGPENKCRAAIAKATGATYE